MRKGAHPINVGGTNGIGSASLTMLVNWMLEATRNRMKASLPGNCPEHDSCDQQSSAMSICCGSGSGAVVRRCSMFGAIRWSGVGKGGWGPQDTWMELQTSITASASSENTKVVVPGFSPRTWFGPLADNLLFRVSYAESSL